MSIASLKKPSFQSSRVKRAFTLAADVVQVATAARDNTPAYGEYLNRLTDMVGVLMGLDAATPARRRDLAVLVYIGCALDYAGLTPDRDVRGEAARLTGLTDPHPVKMAGWAKGTVPLPSTDSDLTIVTSAWLLNDAENYPGYFDDAPEDVKSAIKRIHWLNHDHAIASGCFAGSTPRLDNALRQIMRL